MRVCGGAQRAVACCRNMRRAGELGVEDDVFDDVRDGRVAGGEMPVLHAIDVEVETAGCPCQAEGVEVAVVQIALGAVVPYRLVIGSIAVPVKCVVIKSWPSSPRRMLKDIHLHTGLLRVAYDGANSWALDPKRALRTLLILKADVRLPVSVGVEEGAALRGDGAAVVRRLALRVIGGVDADARVAVGHADCA